MAMLLEQICKENDIKKIRKEDWEQLAAEIREFLIEKISVKKAVAGYATAF